jgi:4a-hydroxytetrahydrobiopterin dehydratase
MGLLSQEQVDEALREGLSGWVRDGDAITRSVQAESFMDGIGFVRRVAEAAEEMNHHPDIDIRWTTVTFTLSTHSEGGLTENDLTLARRIDSLAP